eukprot:TRINITY_DN90505_c0_g1_i1.p1 TRINITY_DN90505_c0_g1~~TRINITY_DN90505_c0_g1_i1.p1  ORF type:complete len:428 (-),score=38.13 TRINITY_DN90505_c0_g1_i1:44-1327(-)
MDHTLASRCLPYLCLICKSPDAQLCSICKAVSFCGVEHEELASACHRHVCKTLTSLHDTVPVSGFQTVNNALEAFCRQHSRSPTRMEQEQLQRFARCNTCGRSPASMKCRCLVIGHCSAACRANDELHVFGVCEKLKITGQAAAIFCKEPGRPALLSKPESTFMTCSWQEYSEKAATTMEDTQLKQPEHTYPSAYQACVHDSLSDPSTVIYALGSIAWTAGDNVTIDVIGVDENDLSNLWVWEEVLHRSPRTSTLDMRFIGPELPFDAGDAVSVDISDRLCDHCRAGKKKLTWTCSPSTYEQFVQTSTASSVCVAFNCGFHEGPENMSEMWVPALAVVAKLGVPFIFTSFTGEESRLDSLAVQSAGMELLLTGRQNPFSSPLCFPDVGFGAAAGTYESNGWLGVCKGKGDELPEAKRAKKAASILSS